MSDERSMSQNLTESSFDKLGRSGGGISAETAINVGGAVAGAIVSAKFGKAGKMFDQGFELYEAGDMGGALEKFENASALGHLAFSMIGYIRFKQGDKEQALAAYKKAMSDVQRKGYAYAFRSELYASTGDTEKATADCCEAVNGSYAGAYNATQESIRDYINFRGEDMSSFEQRCFPLLKAAAESGNKFAYAGLAECYDQGYGTAKDEKEAMKWFEKAADVGYLNGMAKTNKSGILFRGILYTYAHKIGGIAGGILGLIFFIVGCVPGFILGRKYSRTLLKKIWPGYSGMEAVSH